MCGIFGWQWSKVPSRSQRERLAVALAIYNDTRGGHSWGYAPAHGARIADLGALAPHAARLAPLPQVIAHTRFATAGAKTPENAHPFVRERISPRTEPTWDRWASAGDGWERDGWEVEDDPQEAREALIQVGFSLSDTAALSDAEAIETAYDLTDFGG